jgi:ribosomal protein S19
MKKITWRNPYVQKKLFAEFLKVRNKKKTKVLYTSSRSSTNKGIIVELLELV